MGLWLTTLTPMKPMWSRFLLILLLSQRTSSKCTSRMVSSNQRKAISWGKLLSIVHNWRNSKLSRRRSMWNSTTKSALWFPISRFSMIMSQKFLVLQSTTKISRVWSFQKEASWSLLNILEEMLLLLRALYPEQLISLISHLLCSSNSSNSTTHLLLKITPITIIKILLTSPVDNNNKLLIVWIRIPKQWIK